MNLLILIIIDPQKYNVNCIWDLITNHKPNKLDPALRLFIRFVGIGTGALI